MVTIGDFKNKDNEKDTHEAFLSPKVGDMFHEMFSYWFTVFEIDSLGVIKIWEHHQKTIRIFKDSDQYRESFAYGTIPGYFVRLYERGKDVSKILEYIVSSDFSAVVREQSKENLSRLEEQYQSLLLDKCRYVTKLEEIESKILDVKSKLYKECGELNEP